MAALERVGQSGQVSSNLQKELTMKLLNTLIERAGLAKRAAEPAPIDHPNFWMYY